MVKTAILTASGVAENVSCQVHTVSITKAAGSACTVDIYDNPTAASGNKIWSGDGNALQSVPVGNFMGGGAIASQGVYVNISAGTPTVVVSYE